MSLSRSIGATLALCALACGGIWGEAIGQAVAEEFTEMSAKLLKVEDGPNRATVSAMLDEGFVMGHGGDIGLVDGVTFSVAFDEGGADGHIDDREAQVLTEKFAEISAH